jgi:anion transporter
VIDLGSTILFTGLPPVELARLLAELEELSLPAGTVVFHKGDPGAALYIVRSGVAESRAGAGGPGDPPLGLFEPGDNFGEMALLNDEPRSATVLALTDVELWVLPRARFARLVAETPSIALALARHLSDRLRASAQVVSRMHQEFDLAAEGKYAGLPADLQRFLRRTAPLDPVPADLAARALADEGAADILRELVGRVPFVSADGNGVYRYHRLFRALLLDKLRAELSQPEWRTWLGQLGETARAMERPEQAVSLLAEAGDVAAATDVAAARAQILLEAGRHDELEAWLAALPGAIDAVRGPLADRRAELLVARHRLAEAVEVLEEAMHGEDATGEGDAGERGRDRRQARARRLAELSFELGRSREGVRWLREAGEEAIGEGTVDDVGPLPETRSAFSGLMALASLSGLRHTTTAAGTLGGRGASRPLGVVLSALLLLVFLFTTPPAGLSREAYLALGMLVSALPLLVFSVLGDHLVTLLMVVGWAGLGLVPVHVALSGFASSGWFLVLGVLGVGVALGRTGLLYRLVLAMLDRVPARPVALTLALVAAGLIFSPVMPNATARTALAAPLVPELAAAIGYGSRSRGSAALAMAVLLGFGQMCSLFLTGSSSGLLVHSLLPAASRARFGWGHWFIAALPLHVVIFAITYGAVLLWLRPEPAAARARDTVRAQLRILGPMTRAEHVATVVLVLLLVTFVAGPALRLDPAWAAVLALVALGAANVLDTNGFKSGINWAFLIFFGVMLSLGDVFHTVGVDAWLAASATAPLAPLAGTPTLFLVALGVVGYIVNFVVRWQAACVLMTLVFVPVASPFGIEPWVVGMTALITTNMWFLPYQSTIYQALYYGAEERAFGHAQVRPVALAYGVACLGGLAASVPVWRVMGLVP